MLTSLVDSENDYADYKEDTTGIVDFFFFFLECRDDDG